MKDPVKVNVLWEDEKMSRLPSGTSYSTVAKFAEDVEKWPSDAWSVVLEFQPETAKKRAFDATARFLVSHAPWERLKPGCVFELYEGGRKTATVNVVSS
ncbi:hypothetical protein [Variovorax sp. KBW07]|uniref:hypothetical protein n=1 Tax=Variovorax sp. KBW07 TaxID=2153358 RepID=UPI000F570B35|nr:hypothetical protein [Variovorax sp. KBW07]